MGDSVPEWITSALIEEHLQIFYKNRDLRVLSIDVKLGVGKNENFSSFIYRAIVKFKVCYQFICRANVLRSVYRLR